MSDELDASRVAIIGMAGRFPGSASVAEFWRHLASGHELICFPDAAELAARGVDPALLADPAYVRAASALEDTERFDAAFFGLSPREAALTDPQHRHFLECAWEAFEDAGYDPQACPGRVGVFAAAGVTSYLLYNVMQNAAARALDPLQLQIANDKDYLATRVSYKLGLRGPSYLVQSACSSSLVALHVACQALLADECDVALVGSASIHPQTRDGYLHQPGGAASRDGHCRSFDADASGTVFGSGAGCVLLKPLDRARRDGDPIYAVILGTAVNNDGAVGKVGYAAPSAAGIRDVASEALANAGVDPATVGFVEAHGMATPIGDQLEVEGLTAAFRAHTDRREYCALGSVKSNLGHLSAASGMAALFKATLALRERVIPPTLHFRRASPAIALERSPFYVNTGARPWPAGQGPRRACVNSIAIGGTNAHVVLEEAPALEPAPPGAPYQVLPLSARSAEALEAATDRLAEHLEEHDVDLGAVAYTLQRGRRAFEHRRATVARDRADALAALDGERWVTGQAGARPAVGFLFSGQGSQYAGMGRNSLDRLPGARAAFDRCAAIARDVAGIDLRAAVLERRDAAADEALRQTALTQPALFAVEYALAAGLRALGIEPTVLVGHSVGEYVAACVAGVFSLEDAVALVCERGRLMAGVAPGAMLAVALGEGELRPLLGDELAIAAINAPTRTVVAGPHEAIAALAARLEGRGARCRQLRTSHAFHSAMMNPIVAPFRERVAAVARSAPRIPIHSNVTGRVLTAEEACDPAYWARHLRGTVRFADGVAELSGTAGALLLEVGPGSTLIGFALEQPGRAADLVAAPVLPSAEARDDDVPTALTAIGRAWVAGVDVDWAGLHESAPRRVSLPTYPFERKRFWIDPDRPAADAPVRAAAQAGPSAEDAAGAADDGLDPIERTMAATWREVLGVSRIGAHDDLVALGGDSIVAVQVLGRLRARLGVDLDPRELFTRPTVAGLAEVVRARRAASPAGPSTSDAGSIHSAPPDGPQALSPAQARMWFLDRLAPGALTHSLPVALSLRGALDPEALARALGRLVARHEALRTTFEDADGTPRQVIAPPSPFELARAEALDLEAARRLLEAEARRPFDLAAGPLFRALLVSVGRDEHALLLVLHHIVSDGWSMAVMVRELTALYAGRELAPLPLQYRDYACWQQGWLAAGGAGPGLDRWRAALADVPPLDLRGDRPRPRVPSGRGASIPVRLSRDLTSQLRGLAERERATLFIVLLAGLQITLGRQTGQRDFAIGTATSGRSRPELEPLIGLFVNTLALRADLSGDPSAAELVARARRTALDAYAHQDVPFEQVVDALGARRDDGRPPLVQVMLDLQPSPPPAMAAGLAIARLAIDTGAFDGFDLSISLADGPDGLAGVARYDADRFDRASIERLVGQFRRVLDRMAADPERRLSDLATLDADERHRVVVRWNDTARPIDETPIHRRVAALAAARPGRVALVHDGDQVSFREADLQANRLAHHLRNLGIGAEEVIGLCLPRSTELVTSMLGIWKAGAAYVPLDPELPDERLRFLLDDSGARAVVTTAALAERLSGFSGAVVLVERVEGPDHEPPTRAAELAYVLYTSGSSGQPKGVMIEHRGLANLAAALEEDVYRRFGPDLAVGLNASIAFDASLQQILQLGAGHTVHVLPDWVRLDGRALAGYLERHRLAVVELTPTQLHLLLDGGALPFERLPALLLGGEAVDAALWEQLRSAPRGAFNAYGPTECTVEATIAAIGPATAQPVVGRPHGNVRVYVLDGALEPVPIGAPGELHIGGAGVGRGYRGRPGLTAERFVPDPFGPPGARLYRTGDLCRLRDDGAVEYLGRIDQQVKLRGYRIEPGEIEARLVRSAGVRAAAVLLRDDGAGPQLVAYVVPPAGASIDLAALRAELAASLPRYMVPTAWVTLTALPLTASGKVDRRALPIPNGTAADGASSAPPEGPTERRLAALFGELLALSGVGAETDFFAAGGHSLLATRLVARVEAEFGVGVPLRAVLQTPTVRDLAALVDARLAIAAPVAPRDPAAPRPESEEGEL